MEMTETKEHEVQILLDLIEEKTGFTIEDLRSKNRKRDIVHVRRTLFVIAYKLLELPYERIGDIVDQDHSTVIHGLKKHNAEIDIYEDYTAVYQSIYKYLEVLFIARTEYNTEYMAKQMDILITQRNLLNGPN